MTHIGREQDACDIGLMGDELADGDQGGDVLALDHAPDVDVTLSLSLEYLQSGSSSRRVTYDIVAGA